MMWVQYILNVASRFQLSLEQLSIANDDLLARSVMAWRVLVPSMYSNAIFLPYRARRDYSYDHVRREV